MNSTIIHIKKYVVYITHYSGDKMPQNYIGSTNIHKINSGYRGSIVSKKYGQIWKDELKRNPDSFSIEIISYHDTRAEALYKELFIQRMFNVIDNPIFINLSYASVNGFFGRDVSGNNHPMFGKTHSIQSKHKMVENRDYNDIKGENNGRADQNLYVFKNIITGEIFEGKQIEFKKLNPNISPAAVTDIVRKGKARKNWILFENESSWLLQRKENSSYFKMLNSKNKGLQHPNIDRTIYKFKNTITNNEYEGIKYDFRLLHNFTSNEIGRMINLHTTIRGWIFVKKSYSNFSEL